MGKHKSSLDWEQAFRTPSQTHYVYLAEAEIAGERKLKIGHTWNVPLRVARLKNQKGVEVRLLAMIPFAEESRAIQTETFLHRRYRKDRSRSEWHAWSDQIISEFSSHPGVQSCRG